MDFIYKSRNEVADWLVSTWNDSYLLNVRERGMRIAEEALELGQCCNMTREEAHALVDQVFDKPKEANPAKEIAGVFVCLQACTVALKVDLRDAYVEERDYRWANQEKIRGKHAAKPVKTTEEERNAAA